jgi:hypothetical protein
MAAPGLPVYDQYMEYEEPVFQLLAAEGVLMESVDGAFVTATAALKLFIDVSDIPYIFIRYSPGGIDAGMVQEYEPIAAE